SVNSRALLVRGVWDLVDIAPQGSHETKLTAGAGVVDQRAESAEAVGSIVEDRCSWRLQSKIGAVAAEAGIVGEAVRMAAKVELVIGLVEISEARDDFGFIIPFESGARGAVEN